MGVRRRRSGVAAAAGAAAAGAALAALCRRVLRIEITGRSMAPTLLPGDRVVAVRGLRVAPGHLVAVPDPREPARLLVKRAVAVEGRLVVLAGDDPAASTDSRHFGPVPTARIGGRVVRRYWPPARAGRVPPHGQAAPWRNLGAVNADRLERVLDPSYVADVASLDMGELRTRRAECDELEVALSYVRRLAQGRLDIAGAELSQRTEGGEPLDVHSLVEKLPGILSDRIHAPGFGRLPTLMAPGAESDLTGELDAVADAARLGRLPDMADAEVQELVEDLQAFEQRVSAHRRALHEQMDRLQAEIIRRYRTGEASVESLLG